jgi:hypothetical protein
MGGGADSRIPSILNDAMNDVSVICRTYSFDPEEAAGQISSWMVEVKPDLVIGESLGCLHALRQSDVPRILISPALNAPVYFEILSWLTLIPGVTWIFDRIYRPREGDRQPLHFTFRTLKKYRSHRKLALKKASQVSGSGYLHAFIGTRDHYLKSAIVSVKTWKKHFGETFTLYDGTHFTEEEYIFSLVIPEISKILNNKK